MNFASIFMFPNVFQLLILCILLSSSIPLSGIHCQAAWVTVIIHQTGPIPPPHTHTWLLFSGTFCTTQWREFIQNVTFYMLLVSLKILWVIFQRKLNPLNLDFPHQNLPVFIVIPVRFFHSFRQWILPWWLVKCSQTSHAIPLFVQWFIPCSNSSAANSLLHFKGPFPLFRARHKVAITLWNDTFLSQYLHTCLLPTLFTPLWTLERKRPFCVFS